MSGINGVERDGCIQPSPTPLQSVYRLDIVDDGFFLVSFCSRLYLLSLFLYWMAYSGMGGVECGGWGKVWWIGQSVMGVVEWNGVG